MQPQGQLFARHFRGDHAQGQVCDLVFGIQPRALGQFCCQPLAQGFHAMPLFGRDQEGFGKGKLLVHLLCQRQEPWRLDAVDLVDGQRNGAFAHHFAKVFKDRFDAFGDAAMRFDQQHDDVGIRCPAPCGGNHCTVQTAAGFEQAGCVHQNDLRIAFHGNATNARAGGLHLVGDDGHFRADHLIGQRGFARIGLSDQSDETGAGGHSNIHIQKSGLIRQIGVQNQPCLCGRCAQGCRRHCRQSGRPRSV